MKYKTSEMMMMLNQNHIIKYMEKLDIDQQREIVEQIEQIDLSVLDAEAADEKRGKIEPLHATTIDEIEKNKERFRASGIKAIHNGEVGAVLLAGGQGSRLGYEKPKGTFNIGVNRDLYIFECLINNLLDVVKEANAWVPLFVMTSADNKKDTIDFFREHRTYEEA